MSTPSAGLAICTRGLRKTYRNRKGRHVAVQGLDLDVPVGGVHGFLGPNGSGKTTSIRMLLGLVRADAGTMHIFGTEVPRGLPEVVGRVGAIVEEPKFFPAFSGRENLILLADAIGAPRTRVDEVLEETALGGTRQGPLPVLLPRDEAAPGHRRHLAEDPGPADLRRADQRPRPGRHPRDPHDDARPSATQGKTVLVSSHILGEVEQVADSVSIIGHGRLLASGPVAQVIGQQGTTSVRVGVADLDAAERVLLEGGLAVRRDAGLLLVDGRAGPGRGHPPAGPPRPLRQRARAGAGRPGVGLPAAHRAREPRGRPHETTHGRCSDDQAGPRRAETPPAAPADALRRPRHPGGGRPAAVPDRHAGPADVRTASGSGSPPTTSARVRTSPRTASSSARTACSPRQEAAHGRPHGRLRLRHAGATAGACSSSRSCASPVRCRAC